VIITAGRRESKPAGQSHGRDFRHAQVQADIVVTTLDEVDLTAMGDGRLERTGS
jgi:hypothetical protein